MNLFDLSGNVAVVTGACTGLGQGMFLRLLEAGAEYSRCKTIMQEDLIFYRYYAITVYRVD
jgi:hypothetical protein